MGNSNKAQNNVIHIEFLTAKQKIKKDKALLQHSNDQTHNEHLQDIIFIQDLTQYYEVDFRQTIFTSDDTIQVKKIIDQVIHSNSNTPTNLAQVSEFFAQNVKSFQIFFNNEIYAQDNQSYKFNYDPLYIEVIYKPKHWMEKLTAKMKTYTSKLASALAFVSRFAYLAIPIYTGLSALRPLLVPTLKTAKMALKSTQNPKAQVASSAIKVLIHTLQSAASIAAPILAIIAKYVPMSKALFAGVGVYFGKGIIWNIAKIGITIFCPFLTPLLMIFG